MKMDSRDMIRVYSKSFGRKLDTDIVMQCAPLIFGEKISNILITEKENSQEAEMLFHLAGFSICLLYQGNKKTVLLVYNKNSFWKYIKKEECSKFLEKYGYNLKTEKEAAEIFQKIAARFSDYMETKQEFPHELGILLGYPLKDVQGFIEHKGKNSLYSGYWKVYSDLQNALITFENYDRAKSILLDMLLKGFPIREILELCQFFIPGFPLQEPPGF